MVGYLLLQAHTNGHNFGSSSQPTSSEVLNANSSSGSGPIDRPSSRASQQNAVEIVIQGQTRSRTDLCPDAPRSKFEHAVWPTTTYNTTILRKYLLQNYMLSILSMCYKKSSKAEKETCVGLPLYWHMNSLSKKIVTFIVSKTYYTPHSLPSKHVYLI